MQFAVKLDTPFCIYVSQCIDELWLFITSAYKPALDLSTIHMRAASEQFDRENNVL